MINNHCECGKKMEAVIVGYLPVPEDHYVGSNIQLICPVCKKCRVEHFFPHSTSEYEAFEKLHLPVRLNYRTGAAVQKIRNLLGSDIGIITITEILKPLLADDFLLLYAELAKMSEDSHVESYFGRSPEKRKAENLGKSS